MTPYDRVLATLNGDLKAQVRRETVNEIAARLANLSNAPAIVAALLEDERKRKNRR